MSLSHHSLIAWRRADDLFIRVHRLTFEAFPAHEKYELGAQLRRAAFSVPANSVEGYARRSPRERRRFLITSQASLAEVGYGLHVAHRLGYVDQRLLDELERDIKSVGAPLQGLIRSIKAEHVPKYSVGRFCASSAVRSHP